MPFFRYSATDKSGAQTTGTIEAPTPDDAMMQLLKNGLTVSQLMKAPDQQPTAGARPAEAPKPAAPQPAQSTTPQPSPQPTTKQAPTDIVRTKIASDHDRMLFFTQFAKQLKAGMGPAAALDDLKFRIPKHMSPAIEDASRAATNGKAISDAFERYPDLFPDHVVAMIRSGEKGGFLDEATELLGDQSQNAASFVRAFWWVRPMIINALIALPLAWLFLQGVWKTWGVVERQGEGASTISAVFALIGSIFKQLLWPVGPVTLVVYVAIYWAHRRVRAEEMRRKRHEIAYRWPAIGARAKHEGLSIFSWVMSKLSKAGLSPKASWELAAETVPNLVVREKLQRVGNALSGQEKLSQAVFKEDLFPQEYAPIIATAEYTGDMPGAFDQLSKISRSEFEAAQHQAHAKSSGWGRIGCMIVGGILMVLLAWFLYRELYPSIAGDLDQ